MKSMKITQCVLNYLERLLGIIHHLMHVLFLPTIMGKHGKNLLEELIVGSVTKKVLAESQCDVLVSIHA